MAVHFASNLMAMATLGSLPASQAEGYWYDNCDSCYQVKQVSPRMKPMSWLTEEREHD